MTDTAPTAAGWWARIPGLFLDLTVLAALLYYFGWVRTQATYGALGVNPSVLDLTTAEYLQRGVNVILQPAILGGVVLTVTSAVHRRWVVPNSGQAPVRRIAILVARYLGWAGLTVTATIVGLVGTLSAPPGIWLPLTLMGGAAALGYADYAAHAGHKPRGGPRVRVSAMVLLAALGGIWAVSLHAEGLGKRYADDLVATAIAQPPVVVFTKDSQSIRGRGVVMTRIMDPDSHYHYRYSGLRLVLRTNTDYIMVPEGLGNDERTLFIVPTTDTRIDTSLPQ
jgi:hypothetical protein